MSLVEKVVRSIGQEIESERPALTGLRAVTLKSAQTTTPEREIVYQSSAMPTSIVLADYKDAISGSNPRGDLFAAFRLRELADPVPMLGERYLASLSSIESVYGQVVRNASVLSSPSYLTSTLAEAKSKFDAHFYARFEGTGNWRPVEAVPEDWYTDDPSRYSWIEVPLSDRDDPSAGLVLTLRGQVQVPLAGVSTFTRCRLQYMLVQFRRPWLDFALFQTNGWWLEGQREGYCSSGLRDANDGVLPLITTGMVIVRASEFDGALRPDIQQRVDDTLQAGQEVHIGPFRLAKPSASVSSVDVVAWRSELVPRSPLSSGPRPGLVRLRNAAGVEAKCIVQWQLNGDQSAEFKITLGLTNMITIPAGATKVSVQILANALVNWKTAYSQQFSEPPTKQFVIRGTLFNLKVSEE